MAESKADKSELPPGAARLLVHPATGSKVYLVGVAYVSFEAPRDVQRCVESTAPEIVLLEVDKERYMETMRQFAVTGDKYGISRSRTRRLLTTIKVVLSGDALDFLVDTSIKVTGALIGSPAGADVIAANLSAKRVGAEIVFADRNRSTVYMRLLWRAAEVRRALEGAAHDYTAIPWAEKHILEVQGKKAKVVEQGRGKVQELKARAEEQHAVTPAADLLDESKAVRDHIKAPLEQQSTWKQLLMEGGCDDTDKVIAAFKRILERGHSKRDPITLDDVKVVRSCGRKAVEHFRHLAIKEGDDLLEELEHKAIGELKQVAGLDPSHIAMKEVLGYEQEFILTRRLWEAAIQSGGRPVVGVVGAAHIKGIADKWDKDYIGTPEAADLAYLMTLPPPGYSPLLPYLTAAGVVAATSMVAYYRPRLAMITAACAAILTTPSVVLTSSMVNRWQRFGQKLVSACEELDKEDPLSLSLPECLGGSGATWASIAE